MADKCSEVEYMLGVSCNKEITKEKSVRKEAKCEQTQRQLGAEKSSRFDMAQTEVSQGLAKC